MLARRPAGNDPARRWSNHQYCQPRRSLSLSNSLGLLGSKAAVIKLTENLAVELKPHNISVFAFHPGLVDGGLTHAALAEDVSIDSPALVAAMMGSRSSTKLGTAVPPELAIDPILLLASGGADELSGRYLTVFDDLRMLTATAETIRRDDLLTLRLRQVAL